MIVFFCVKNCIIIYIFFTYFFLYKLDKIKLELIIERDESKMKAIKKIIATAICLMIIIGLCIFNPINATEEPLLTVAFMSDLHNQQSTLESGNIRNSITKVCDDLATNENTDVLVIGGDVTSDSYVSKPVLESVLNKVVN